MVDTGEYIAGFPDELIEHRTQTFPTRRTRRLGHSFIGYSTFIYSPPKGVVT